MNFQNCMKGLCKNCKEQCVGVAKAKYNNIRTNGYDSKKESIRANQLKLLERTGKISDLHEQVEFELQPKYVLNNRAIRKISYIADFTYQFGNKLVVEDVKASKYFKTDVYRLKKKLFEFKYKIEIKEIY